jgi:methylase of polypeptide subunit release factors
VKRFLNKDGILCFEIGKGQYDLINKIFYKNGFKLIYKEKDLQGIDRVVVYKLN